MSAIILDTETTDLDKPEVIELAYIGPLMTPFSAIGDGAQLQFKPTKPISLGAMCTHHIIADDLADCETWPGSWSIPGDCGNVEYLIGHNVDFDWKAIGSPNLKRICTLALARHVWPKLDSHSLGALMYYLYPHGMARKLVRGAHSAMTDAALCGRLLFALIDALRPRDWKHLYELSEKARVPTHMTFGKYGPKDGQPGMLIADMRRADPGYVRWLLQKADIVKGDPYWQKALTA